jgi:hypothetical protein
MTMPRLRFGAFLAPHHPLGESPTLLLRRDLDFAEHLDRLGYDEFWCGEHHSTGWEMIASPEMFLAAAAERTHRIRLGTGVISLPYHHPFNVAQRLVQLDHMSGGRLIFGLELIRCYNELDKMRRSESSGACFPANAFHTRLTGLSYTTLAYRSFRCKKSYRWQRLPPSLRRE